MSAHRSLSKMIKASMMAALVGPLVVLLRLPIDAWFSGLGLLRLLGPLPYRILFSALVTWFALLILGLPTWLLYRKLSTNTHLSHFALYGMFLGLLFAWQVDPSAYRDPNFRYSWTRGGQTNVRPTVDAIDAFLRGFLPITALWFTAYRRGDSDLSTTLCRFARANSNLPSRTGSFSGPPSV